ncbi:MAG: DUF2087 domain-containing protein [Syntrophomonas sp.]|nr:DUF2087 domain-containing protein [Syntrophomonas sp.]
MDISELFWNASMEELKAGYIEDKEHYICLLCGRYFDKGIVYPEDGVIYTSGKYINIHIEKEHRSVFAYLIDLDKKLTGLTEHQRSLLKLFYRGLSDKEIQHEMGIGSSSTIRNHRFSLKEKERQAKVFLALMELLKAADNHAPSFVEVHKTARMVDERYNVTLEEKEAILKKYFPDGINGPLKSFSRKEKIKIVVLREIAQRFEPNRYYNEKEVNQILKTAFDDYATLRRYLIDYGFLDRKLDGSLYWLKK